MRGLDRFRYRVGLGLSKDSASRGDLGGLLKSERPNGERRRVAVFQAFYRFHSSTSFTIAELVRFGYEVDLFLLNASPEFPVEQLVPPQGCRVHTYKMDHGRRSRARRGLSKAVQLACYALHLHSGLIPRRIVKSVRKEIVQHAYAAFIGIERGGLIWAKAAVPNSAARLIYSSLELYTSSHWISKDLSGKRLKAAERAAHRKCWATIVQDPKRGEILLADNKILKRHLVIYLPISRYGPARLDRSTWLQDELVLGRDTSIVLSYGLIQEGRYSVELAKLAQTDFEKSWCLVFHGSEGWGSRALTQIREVNRSGRVKLSLRLVDVTLEPVVVSSAHISLVLYNRQTINDELTGFASEKLALSLQCGIPVIAFAYPTYEHVEREGGGVLISDISEIPNAVRRILGNYGSFRRGAFAAYARYYRFETNFAKVIAALEQVPL